MAYGSQTTDPTPGDQPTDQEKPTETSSVLRALLAGSVFGGDSAAGPFIGALGRALYQPGDGEVQDYVGPDGRHYKKYTATPTQITSEAQQAYNTLKEISTNLKLPIQYSLALEWQAQQNKPIPIDGVPNEGFRQIAIDGINYLDGHNMATPDLLKFRDEIIRTIDMDPETFRKGRADTNNHDFDLLRTYYSNGTYGATITAAYTRKLLDENYNYDPTNPAKYTEAMHEIGSRIYLTQVYGENTANRILNEANEENIGAFFTSEQLEKNPELKAALQKEFGDKQPSAYDLLQMARNKMNVDVGPLLGSLEAAFGNRGVAANLHVVPGAGSAAEAARFADVSTPIFDAGEKLFRAANVPIVGVNSPGEAMLAMSHFESGGWKSQITNSIGAFGLFQFIPSTRDLELAQCKQEGLLPTNVDYRTIESQATLGAHFTLGNAKFLQANGFEVNLRNLYLSHWWGQVGAKNLLLADPNTPINRVLLVNSGESRQSEGFRLNGLTGNETVQQLLDLTNERMARSLALVRQYAGTPDPQTAPQTTTSVPTANNGDPYPMLHVSPDRNDASGVEQMIPLLAPEFKQRLNAMLDAVQKEKGMTVFVQSAYRDEIRNREAGGAANSNHMRRIAADFDYKHVRLANGQVVNLIGDNNFQKMMAQYADRFHLYSGMNFNDPDHIQLAASNSPEANQYPLVPDLVDAQRIAAAENTAAPPPAVASTAPAPTQHIGLIKVAAAGDFRNLRLNLGAPIAPVAPAVFRPPALGQPPAPNVSANTLVYYVSTGQIVDGTGRVIVTAYSGNGLGRNNPSAQATHDYGPIPAGITYNVGTPAPHGFHMQDGSILTVPNAVSLEAPAGTQVPGNRDGFFFHPLLTVNTVKEGVKGGTQGCIGVLNGDMDKLAAYIRDKHITQLLVLPEPPAPSLTQQVAMHVPPPLAPGEKGKFYISGDSLANQAAIGTQRGDVINVADGSSGFGSANNIVGGINRAAWIVNNAPGEAPSNAVAMADWQAKAELKLRAAGVLGEKETIPGDSARFADWITKKGLTTTAGWNHYGLEPPPFDQKQFTDWLVTSRLRAGDSYALMTSRNNSLGEEVLKKNLESSIKNMRTAWDRGVHVMVVGQAYAGDTDETGGFNKTDYLRNVAHDNGVPFFDLQKGQLYLPGKDQPIQVTAALPGAGRTDNVHGKENAVHFTGDGLKLVGGNIAKAMDIVKQYTPAAPAPTQEAAVIPPPAPSAPTPPTTATPVSYIVPTAQTAPIVRDGAVLPALATGAVFPLANVAVPTSTVTGDIRSPARGVTAPPGVRFKPYPRPGDEGLTHVHWGWDFQGSNVPLYAASAGTVTFRGENGHYENVMVVSSRGTNGELVQDIYSHLASGGATPGAQVKQGDKIATTGSHLFYGRFVNGVPVDSLTGRPMDKWQLQAADIAKFQIPANDTMFDGTMNHGPQMIKYMEATWPPGVAKPWEVQAVLNQLPAAPAPAPQTREAQITPPPAAATPPTTVAAPPPPAAVPPAITAAAAGVPLAATSHTNMSELVSIINKTVVAAVTDAIADYDKKKQKEKEQQVAQENPDEKKDQLSAGKHFDGIKKPKSAANDVKKETQVAANTGHHRHQLKTEHSTTQITSADKGPQRHEAGASTSAPDNKFA